MIIGSRYYPHITMYGRKPNNYSQHDNPMSAPLRALELAFQEVESRKVEMYRRGMLTDHPTVVEHEPIRILISSSPCAESLPEYAKLLRAHNVTQVVRVCEPTYPADKLRALGFTLHEMPFADGEPPSKAAISAWLALLDNVFNLEEYSQKHSQSPSTSSTFDFESGSSTESASSMPRETVAVHCAAGLGRAPMLAAIALVEAGMDPFEAVGSIRASRRGAMNGRQMAFLESYSRRPPPMPVKVRQRSRSSSFVGSFWPSLRAARPFRPRSPSQNSTSSTARQQMSRSPKRLSDT